MRREDSERKIVVFERSPHTSYSASGIPYFIGGVVDDPERLIARSPEKFREKYRIEARVRHEVVAIDHDNGQVRVRNLADSSESWESYDQLLIATGADPFTPEVPGSAADGIFGLSTLQSGLRVHRAWADDKPRKAVIVGGGYIGLEMAEALIRLGLKVSLVQRGQQVMSTLDPDMGALIHIALGTVANKQGSVAGVNLAGGYATFPGVVGTAASKICQYEVARTGLRETEIRQAGLEGVCAALFAGLGFGANRGQAGDQGVVSRGAAPGRQPRCGAALQDVRGEDKNHHYLFCLRRVQGQQAPRCSFEANAREPLAATATGSEHRHVPFRRGQGL